MVHPADFRTASTAVRKSNVLKISAADQLSRIQETRSTRRRRVGVMPALDPEPEVKH
jgi:hypothetical protein